MNDNVRLEIAFKFVKKTFFPRWDKMNQWIVKEDPELLRRNSIHDLSWAYSGKPLCLKLNETDSQVFKEFENFLAGKLGVEVLTISKSFRQY